MPLAHLPQALLALLVLLLLLAPLLLLALRVWLPLAVHVARW